ncbi:hypothetical protein Zmor_014523 [Zophobas morio]|uniref:Sodium channel protein Nach n=1 Tax=Zophobas morio TaxID=2755281 RepID=A0AA38IJZ6_9CUCU|nr:hypothetical protein Zmor_014523 [Zophobas morio]
MRVYPIKEKSTWLKVKNYLREYCKVSNIHGVRYLAARRSNIERLTWTFFILLSMCCCTFMIYKIWQKYENNPIVINFSSKQLSVYDVPFPAVTICPESKSSSLTFNYSDVYYKIRSQIKVSDEKFKVFHYMYLLCDEFDTLKLNISKTVDEDFFATIKEFHPNLTEVCYFQGRECVNVTFDAILTKEGICYSFNTLHPNDIYKEDVIFYQHIFSSYDQRTSDFNVDTGYAPNTGILTYPRRPYASGVQFGFLLNLIDLSLQTDAMCTSFSRGFKVLIHSPLEVPRFDNHYFQVSYNKVAMVAVQPEVVTTSNEVKKIHPEKRECYLGNEKSLKYFRTYTHSNCLLECITNFTLTECGCVSYFMPRTNNTKICGTGSRKCILRAEENMIREEIENKYFKKRTTQCDCKSSCNNWQYTTERSEAEYDLNKMLMTIFKEAPLEYIKFKIFHHMYLLCDDFDSLELNISKTVNDDFFTVISQLQPDISLECAFQNTECKNGTFTSILTKDGICYSFNILNLNDIYREDVMFHPDISSTYNQESDFNVDTGYAPDAGVFTYPKRPYTSGYQYGFVLFLADLSVETDALCSSFNQGFNVYIHNPLELPRFGNSYFHISYKKHSMVAIQPEVVITSDEVKKFHPEKRKCYLGSERPLKYFRTYTQSNCFLECLTNYTLITCGCVAYYMPRTNNTKICGTGSITNRYVPENMISEEMANKYFKKRITKCDCKPSCNNWQYITEMSEDEFDVKKRLAFKFKEPLLEDTDAKFSVMAIFFKREQFMALERAELYSVFDFISNFGGLLGLFIGFSLLSLVEILYFFTLRIFYNNRLFGGWSNSV